MDQVGQLLKVSAQIASDAYCGVSNIAKDYGLVLPAITAAQAPATPPPPPPPPPMSRAMMMLNLFGSSYPGSNWVRLAGLSGAIAVGMGAYGAHGLKDIPEQRKAVFETANRYHFIHALALLAVPLVNKPNLVGSLMVVGTCLFSGTCYVHALNGSEDIIRYTPYGGLTLIAAWLAMIL